MKVRQRVVEVSFGVPRGDEGVFGVQVVVVACLEVMEVLVCLLGDMVVRFMRCLQEVYLEATVEDSLYQSEGLLNMATDRFQSLLSKLGNSW
ncbi:hypothetical protein Tco_0808842 [Tanacetum coccineum]